MDPFTHTLFGWTLSEAGLRRLTALATPTLLIGANLPDVDAVTYAFGGDAYGWRRGWTHGVLAMVVLPLLLAGLMLLVDRFLLRRKREQPIAPKALLLLSAVSVWSHPILDWLNTYGMRFLMPFDDTWFYGDALFIVDVWVWLLLSVLFVAARFFPTPIRQRRALAALAVVSLYAGLSWFSSQTVESRLRAELPEVAGIEVEKIVVSPVPVRTWEREAIVSDGEVYHFVAWNWFATPRWEVNGSVPLRPAGYDEAIHTACEAQCVDGFVHWMRMPFYEVDEIGAGEEDSRQTLQIHLMDARYVKRRVPGFAVESVTIERTAGSDGRIACP